MKILIVVASRHHSTFQIAEALGDELRSFGHEVLVEDPGTTTPIGDFDAVLIGSGVYVGQWLAAAREFVGAHARELANVPVWLFSSGPLGADEPKPSDDPPAIKKLLEETGARGHKTFVGKLDPAELGLGEKLIARLVRAPEGDFRDWQAVRDWARHIAQALAPALVS